MPRRGKTVKRRSKSTRAKSAGPVLSIPELRKSMEYISEYTESLLSKGSKSVDAMAKEFAAEWKKVFGKSLSLSAAKNYIRHVLGGRKGKKTRKQRGGATLAGAPLDYMTRPGVPLPYGNYLEYVQKGFWNPEPAILKDCGTQQGVLPSATVGTNVVGKMNGGGLLDSVGSAIGAFAMRPFVAQNPVPPQYDAMSAWKGQGTSPGPESWQQTWKPQMSGAQLPPLTLSPVFERDLAKDVITR